MTKSSQIQILDKSDYTKQYLISLETEPSVLSAGCISIQSRILSITTNNFTYARLGHLMGWWSVWKIPETVPDPYNDTTRFGRISSWGYAEVLESNHDEVPVGTKLYGYMPIGDGTEDLEVAVDAETGHLWDVSKSRQHLLSIYNQYIPFTPETDLDQDRDGRGWDSLIRPLFETSYLLNRFVFSWDEKRTHPFGTSAPWTAAQADLANAIVILLAPSGKTGLMFAHQLRHARPKEKQPRKVVAVGSQTSKIFSESTGLFDHVLLYSDARSGDIVKRVGVDKDTNVVLINFGARGDAEDDWYDAVKSAAGAMQLLIVGGDPSAAGRSKLAALAEDPASGVARCNMSGLRDCAMSMVGNQEYYAGVTEEWSRLKKGGVVNGSSLKWGRGMEEFKQGWDELCNGKYGPDVGLVYEV
ncbi:hypothetical protein FALBO_5010 [Fusarium albosuccineum]|uniref:Uncharacterized protein n=1 Tax=Fusarium albosuccineum TaxID=1237068 RepID=A0A8H4LGU6_9HYPO|nr:hypothetical protein FALBO_5010 [Fusarium albosuccineum]